MIITETITINGREFVHTYSDSGMLVERDNLLYEDAIDLPESEYIYNETDVPLTDIDDTEFGRMVKEGLGFED